MTFRVPSGLKRNILTNLITTDSSRKSCSVELDQHIWRVKVEEQVGFLRNLHQPDQFRPSQATPNDGRRTVVSEQLWIVA
jgi:hypothetical protein